jgi:hypothetical protein
MRSSIFRRLAVVSAIALMALGTTACDSGDDTTPTTPTIPTPNVTETFAGSINVNGAATFTFPTSAAGQVTANSAALRRQALSRSPWHSAPGTVNCQVVLTNDRASQGGTLIGSVSGAGTLCVRSQISVSSRTDGLRGRRHPDPILDRVQRSRTALLEGRPDRKAEREALHELEVVGQIPAPRGL